MILGIIYFLFNEIFQIIQEIQISSSKIGAFFGHITGPWNLIEIYPLFLLIVA